MNGTEVQTAKDLNPPEPDPEQPMKRFRVQFDFTYTGLDNLDMTSGESETVPDMNLTVRQLLENHTRGIDGNVQAKTPHYFETEVPTFKDLTDVDEYKEHLQHQLTQVEQFIEDERKQQEEAERQRTDEDVPKDPETGQTEIPVPE